MDTRIYQTAIVLLVIALVLNQCDKQNIKNSTIPVVEYEFDLTSVRDSLGREIASKQVILAREAKHLLTIQENEGTIGRLKALAQENEDALALMAADVRTEIRVLTDSVQIVSYKDSLPVYESYFSDKWRMGKVTMGSDSLDLRIKVFNEFDVSLNEKKRWFKKNQIILDIRNNNPNTTTESLDSFVIDSQISPWSVGLSAGYGMSREGISPFVGISLNYGLLQL